MIKIMKYSEVKNDEIFARVVPTVNVADIVSEIIENVKANGDKALFEYCKKNRPLCSNDQDFIEPLQQDV